MMKYNLGLLIVALLIACNTDKTITFSGETMGTLYNIKIVSSEPGQAGQQVLKEEIDKLLIQLNNQMSTYIENSEISRFNVSIEDTPFDVSQSFIKVLSLASQITAESGGAFDATVMPAVNLWGFGREGRRDDTPSDRKVIELKEYVGMDKITIDGNTISKSHAKTELDFSAIAKGYGVDLVADLLGQKGFANYMVEIGGEVVVKGVNAKSGPWRIGIDRPEIEPSVDRNFQAILEIKDVAVATSGDYRNYFISGDSRYRINRMRVK